MAEYKFRPWMRPLEFDRPTWVMLESDNIYTSSRRDFRWRHCPNKQDNTLKASVYTTMSYEFADDVQDEIFPLSEEGLRQANEWIASKFQEFIEANPTRYK